MEIGGLRSREFEVDLLFGETISRPPIRVRLTKTMSFARRASMVVLTFGMYEVWTRFIASGGHVFENDERLAVTSFGRLLLWSHRADGGSQPLLEHVLTSLKKPPALIMLTVVVLFVAIGPVTLGANLGVSAGIISAILFGSLVAALIDWLFERASLCVTTSVRQFEAHQLSCVRLLCYSYKSFLGFGHEVVMCQAHMFFGHYPWDWQMRRTSSGYIYDSRSVTSAFAPVGDEASRVIPGSHGIVDGQNMDKGAPSGFIGFCSAVLVCLAFAAFMTEMVDFITQVQSCRKAGHSGLNEISLCVHEAFKGWWGYGANSNPTATASHYIEAMDWSLQITLFFYIVAPVASFLWGSFSDQTSAGIGFIVERYMGASTEDESFDDHWEELSSMITELFQGTCGHSEFNHSSESIHTVMNGSLSHWTEVPGDLAEPRPTVPPIVGARFSRLSRLSEAQVAAATAAAEARSSMATLGEGPEGRRPGAAARAATKRRKALPPLPRASWRQLEEMMGYLLDAINNKVRVYTGVLSFQPDEKVLAVYPERARITFFVKVKILLTCGLEYLLHWRRQRYEGAIILTDRRLIQASTYSSIFCRTAKVDMYSLGPTVKLVVLAPPMRLICRFPQGRLAVATHRGTLELRLLRLRRLTERAHQLWKGLALLQDAPSVTAVQFSDFVTVVDDDEEEEEVDGDLPEDESDRLEQVQQLARESLGVLGRPSFPANLQSGRRDSGSSEAQPADEATGNGAAVPPRPVRMSLDMEPQAAPAAADQVTRESMPTRTTARQSTRGMTRALEMGHRRAETWGLVLAEGERVLWGPVLFEEEVMRPICCPNVRRRALNYKNPTCLVTITDCRLVVMQFKTLGPVWLPLCQRVWVSSIASVPLRWVSGFCIEEAYTMQQSQLTRIIGQACLRPLSESSLTIRVMTDAGMGKLYLRWLSVHQRVLPRAIDSPCNFEEDKVLELRRWLGNVALFFSDGVPGVLREQTPVELWRCSRGLAPA